MPPVEAWEKVFLNQESFFETVHGRYGCITCHGGVGGTSDIEAAHGGMVRDPASAEACGDCHPSHVETVPAREAAYGDLAEPIPPVLRDALREAGIERLYSHQVEAIEGIRSGKNVVVVTGTASGKTLCYNIPIIEKEPALWPSLVVCSTSWSVGYLIPV